MNRTYEVKIECKCGYKWESKSELQRVTCPSCGNKVRVWKETINRRKYK